MSARIVVNGGLVSVSVSADVHHNETLLILWGDSQDGRTDLSGVNL
jgi:hypothetical protein